MIPEAAIEPVEIRGLAVDSRKVAPGFLFAALPGSLREADVVNEDLDVLAKDAAESHQVTTNPVPSTQEDLKRLLLAVLE